MRATTCLTLLAAGAIATFAVHLPAWPVNIQLAGLIVMVTGILGYFVPARPSEWMRRRIIVHGDLHGTGPAGPDDAEDDDERYASYLWQDPAVLAAQVLSDIEAAAGRRTAGPPRPQPGHWRPGGQPSGPRRSGARLAGPRPPEVALASRRLRSVKPPEDDRQAGTG